MWDLSLKPQNAMGVVLAPVIANHFLPLSKGKVYITRSKEEFEEQVAQFRPSNRITAAIYQVSEVDVYESFDMEHAADIINSPLTDWPKERLGQADYPALYKKHLRQVLLQEKEPMAHLGQEKLWQHILQQQ
jgi:hypothetical protein